MKICYASDRVRRQCTGLQAALKLFGGNKNLAVSLLSRINAIENAEVLKDIIMMPTFRFHSLKGKMNDLFAVDVKNRKQKWRIILRPLDENEMPFYPCYIDQIALDVTIVEIMEVSAQYE